MMLVVQCQEDHEKHSVDDAHRHQKQGRREGFQRAGVGLIEIQRADQQDDRPGRQAQDKFCNVQVHGKQPLTKLAMFASGIEDDRLPLALQINDEPYKREQSHCRGNSGEAWEQHALRIEDIDTKWQRHIAQ